MSSTGDQTPSNLEGLFASLRSNNTKAYPAGISNRQDASPAPSSTNRQPSSFDFVIPSSQSQPVPSFEHAGSNLSYGFNGARAPTTSPQATLSKGVTSVPPSDQSSADRTANLLNLLKFNQPSPSAPATPPPQQPMATSLPGYAALQAAQSPSTHSVHGRGISASDLIASFMGKPLTPVARETTNTSPAPAKVGHAKIESTVPASQNPQDFLLQLLNRPKPEQSGASTQTSQPGKPNLQTQTAPEATVDGLSRHLADTILADMPATLEEHKSIGSPARNESPIRIFGINEATQPTPFEPKDMPKVEPQQTPKKPIFTYVNPFDQLAASSPRNAKSTKIKQQADTSGEGHKRKSKEPSPGPTQPSSRRKITSSGDEILQSVESPGPAPLKDGRSHVEALMGIGAPSTNPETVAEALNEVGGQVNKQVEYALAKAENEEAAKNAKIKHEGREDAHEPSLDALEQKLQDAAIDIKHELDQPVNKGVLEEALTTPVAQGVKEIIDEAAAGNARDAWESADGEDSPTKDDQDHVVPVYNFPMRPFVSIDIKQARPPHLLLREDSIMDIARFKKEFDQIDRTLATATTEFIVYAVPKHGGLRIIRQDDGLYQQIFPNKTDRIFNVSISTAPPGTASHGVQTVIATSIGGTVYWATVAKPEEEIFDKDHMEQHGLVFPPVPSHDDNTSGGQLKTRAKRSNRHPEFFAIGRGKIIQIVFPEQCRQSNFVSNGSVVETEKYFKDRSLKITTGKAGKDFTFSEDDSTIVSLDKAGRLRFWDIRDLVEEANATASKLAPAEVKTPLLTFVTTSPTEKSWPTSLLFADKPRPYVKGTAVRYIIVGMKQNHTLQLWDLGLGKAVQEVNFPHEKESDAICSVAYHPGSGIIVVGHPTRNSIYFVHLSAPKYNLPAMAQAKYVQRLANKDPSLPRPEATAIMSGMREFSFASKGQLRSFELLSVPAEVSKTTDEDEHPILFDLYVMHSKGVTCLNIKKDDLGWSKDSKVLYPIDAEAKGDIVVKDLREPQGVPFSEVSSANGDPGHSAPANAPHTTKILTKETGENFAAAAAKANNIQRNENATTGNVDMMSTKLEASALNGSTDIKSSAADKAEKKKKKRAGASAVDASSILPPAPSSYADAAQRARSPKPQPSLTSNTDTRAPAPKISADTPRPVPSIMDSESTRSITNGESISLGIQGDFLDKELKKIEKGVSAEFSKVMNRELDSLYRRFDEDKRVQDAAGAAKQDAILRLVSSTLGDNVEKALSRIIGASIQQVVLPAISDVTASAIDRKVSEVLTQQLHHAIPPQLKLALPEAMSKAVQKPEVLRVISDQIASKVSALVESEFSTALHNTISPAFKNLAISAAQSMAAETERRVRDQIQKAGSKQQEDRDKIENLTKLVRSLSETVHTMAAAQSGFQNEILKLQTQVVHERQAESSRTGSRQYQEASLPSTVSPPPAKSPQQEELEAISAVMTEGRYEEGTIQWLQSGHQVELFDQFFVRCSPAYLQHLSPLVALSVGAAVTATLETNIMERLTWLENVFATIDPKDPEIRDVVPSILDVLSQRLEGQYMRIAEIDPRDPVLRKIPPLTRRARELRALS
ncbi:MAG: hypothetical protein FRX48_06687 [Lasallia pustulata]|uniref:EDC4-like protein pdc1 beta-propeller domain-containing protein n=1 Tax=Lasallia pustulata TaxID=136370 RepID=A0A5M8PKT8_9LECA|nr:MAG: hypothetical protein FRX48_06687 [Lasallia pustulata]